MALNRLSSRLTFLFSSRLCPFQKRSYLSMMVKTKITEQNPLSRMENNFNYSKNLHQSSTFYNLTSTYEHLISQPNYCTSAKTKSNGKTHQKQNDAHKFPKALEDILNQQVTEEFNAAFAYLSMASFFGRTEVALPGCQGFFMNMYEEELEHAVIFLNFILMRGARVHLKSIAVPENQDWDSISCAFNVAVTMEQSIKDKLNNVFEVAEKHKDLQVMDLVSTSFMEEQNRSICEMSRLLKQAEIVEDPVGRYLFDKMLYNSFVKKSGDNLMYKDKLDSNSDTNKVYK